MKLLMILSVGAILAGTASQAIAGGGGCGDVCDKKAVLLECVSTAVQAWDAGPPENEEEAAAAEALQRRMKPGLLINIYGISWSQRAFDPAVLYSAYIPGLFSEIYSDQLKWPSYDHTQGYRIDPHTGAFEFAAISGWDKLKIRFLRPEGGALTELSFSALETGHKLLTVQLACEQPPA